MAVHALIRCHCGQLAETVELRDSIPINNQYCHCNICRQTTGALLFAGLALSSPPVEVFMTKLTKYATSEDVLRYFCKVCGTHVCYYVVKEHRWNVCSGAVDQVIGHANGSLEKIVTHEYVGDTKDGGLLPFFPQTVVHLEADGGPTTTDWRGEITRLHSETEDVQLPKALQAACRCGQVKFSLSRPNDDHVSAKWEAGICVCRSCRLSFGQSIVPWAFNIPFAKVTWPDGTAHNGDLHHQLGRFQSSDHACRDFCTTCGASIFYYSTRQPGLLDIAFGVLRAADGALAKSWVKWKTDRIYYPEDAVDKDLIGIVQENLELIRDSS